MADRSNVHFVSIASKFETVAEPIYFKLYNLYAVQQTGN